MTNQTRKGRPPGSSRYAGEDEKALEHMYRLVENRMPIAKAARIVAEEMNLAGYARVERIRKKFTRERTEIKARLAARASSHAPPSDARPRPMRGIPAFVWEQARFLSSPEGQRLIKAAEEAKKVAKAAQEGLRFVDLKLVREVSERIRRGEF